MKHTKIKLTVILIAISSFVFTSCEKVIQIDLNSSNPILVAEGQMLKDSVAWIKLSYTSDYFNIEQQEYEENATVSISDNNNSETLTYVGNGIYKGQQLLGQVSQNYTINITTGKEEHTATSTLYKPTEIYGIIFKESEIVRPGHEEDEGTTYSLEIKFKDDTQKENYYLTKLFVNNRLDSYLLIDDKMHINENVISYPVMKKFFSENDILTVDIYSVDKNTYTYYSQLNDAVATGMKPGEASTPYNPYSNFNENVMGYFAALSHVSQTVVVQ